MSQQNKPKTALEAQEKLYNNILLSFPYYDKAHLVTVMKGIADKRKADKAPKEAFKVIGQLSDTLAAMRQEAAAGNNAELKTRAFELTIRSLELLLHHDFSK